MQHAVFIYKYVQIAAEDEWIGSKYTVFNFVKSQDANFIQNNFHYISSETISWQRINLERL